MPCRPSRVFSAGCKLAGIGLALQLGACVNSTIEQVKKPGVNINSIDSIVILARRHENATETEADFTDCVEQRLSEEEAHLHVYPRKTFIDAMFPWFEPGTAPVTTDALPRLLANPGVRDQIERTGVRYVVWLDGSTERIDSGGTMSCALSPAGGGCLGFGWWEDSADYEATIWDLQTASTTGMVSADVSGTSYMPALVIPIPLIARTQAAACKGLATQLSQFLGGVPEEIPGSE
jgi:hypothetical protein